MRSQAQSKKGLNPDLRQIAEIILPPDVFMLATERDQISLDFSNKVENSRNLLVENVDDFLKSLIDLMEKVKMKVEKRIVLYHDKFEQYYDQFITHTEDFLVQCVKFIQKAHNLEEIKKIYSDNNQDFDQVLRVKNGPLESEVDLIMKNRQYGRELETLLLKIQQVYEKFNLKNMRDTLDQKLSTKNLPMNPDVFKLVLDNANVDITNMMMVEGRFDNEGIVPKFKKFDELEKLKKEVKKRVEEAGIEIRPGQEVVGVRQKNLKARIGDYIKGGKLEDKLTEERAKLKNRIKNLRRMGSPLKKVGRKSVIKKAKKPVPSIVPGIPSLARISDSNLEVNLHFDPLKSKIRSKKVININEPQEITAMRSLDSRNLALGSKSGILRIIDIMNNQGCLKRSLDLGLPINYILPHPTQKLSMIIALNKAEGSGTANGGYMRLVDMSKPEKSTFHKFENCKDSTLKVCLGPDVNIGKLILSCTSAGEILAHELKSKKLIKRMKLHNGVINDMDFMPTSSILLTGSNDKHFKVFKFNKQNHEITQFLDSTESAEVIKVKAFSKNNSFCAICLKNGEIKIWNVLKKQ